MRRRAAVLVALLVACSDQHPLGPASASLSRRAPEAGTAASEPLGVTTLTWNVYVGADIERVVRSEEHTSELQSRGHLVCRLLLEKKKKIKKHQKIRQT